MKSSIRFEEPPASKRSSNPTIAIAAALKARPNEWAIVHVAAASALANNKATQIRAGRARAFTPAGAFEAKTRVVDGEYRVYARFVGSAE
ncbi:hypothetical protein [Embleya sp. NPDC001921]